MEKIKKEERKMKTKTYKNDGKTHNGSKWFR